MVDIVITAASVLTDATTTTRQGSAGETVTAGKVVYLDSATGAYKLADSNGAAALRSPVGIALNGASAGQPLSIALSGQVTIGAVMTAGGGILPFGHAGRDLPGRGRGNGRIRHRARLCDFDQRAESENSGKRRRAVIWE